MLHTADQMCVCQIENVCISESVLATICVCVCEGACVCKGVYVCDCLHLKRNANMLGTSVGILKELEAY